ncbi:hypothetical protein [Clostridium sp.]|nr:hypothetical protein [Clostridium sp.]
MSSKFLILILRTVMDTAIYVNQLKKRQICGLKRTKVIILV